MYLHVHLILLIKYMPIIYLIRMINLYLSMSYIYLRWYPLGDYNVGMKGESRAKTSLWRRARGQQGHSNPRVLIKKRISYIYIYFFN